MQVLYLHPTSANSGASKSLIELYLQLYGSGVLGSVLTPAGAASKAFSHAQMEVVLVKGLSQFDDTLYGHYRQLRWFILFREVFLMPFSLLALLRLKRKQFDVIHLNEITLLPLGWFAKCLFKVPLVVHVRSLQRGKTKGLRSRLITYVLKQHADAVIAIDQTVAASLAEGVPVKIVHNGLSLKSASIEISPSPQSDSVPSVALLGTLVRFKGVYEFLEAARILVKERGVCVQFLIAGENIREVRGLKSFILKIMGFSEDVRSEVERRIIAYGLADHVRLLHFVEDVRNLYPNIDILCFPSYLNAPGRPVFEAACFGIPSVVVVRNPLPDAVIDGVTGLTIAYPDPVLLADALEKLIADEAYRKSMGQQAKAWAEQYFSTERNAAVILAIYRGLVDTQGVKCK
jgi:glycosyltransferase involved in cell wall biosynthesis